MTAADKQFVDPALWPLVDAFPPIDVTAGTLQVFRAALAGMSALPDPASHPDVRVETVAISGGGPAAPSIRCLLLRPAHTLPASALLHVHGGGFVMGTVEMDVPRNIALVRATGAAVLSVDYRLAPEHPHPAGLEDCHAALQWLRAQASAMGFAATRIGVIGESAGAGLAATLALLARDRGSGPLACQALIYPMLVPPRHSCEPAAGDARTGRFIWTRASNEYCWSALLGTAAHTALAGLAGDLSRLPPAFLAVGDLDLFVHDCLDFTGRLLRAGTSVESHLYAGAIHGFDRAVDAPVTQRFTAELAGFLRRHLG